MLVLKRTNMLIFEPLLIEQGFYQGHYCVSPALAWKTHRDHFVHCCSCCCLLLSGSVPSKVVCREIGPALGKIGSTDFVRMSKKYAFSWLFSQFSAKAKDFGARNSPILSNLVELSQAQNPLRKHCCLGITLEYPTHPNPNPNANPTHN